MNKDNERYLLNTFPDLLEKLQPAYVDGPYFACLDGWFNLINKLCEKLLQLKKPDLKLISICESSGILIFYITGASGGDTSQLVNYIENLSRTTCERCGRNGKHKRIVYTHKTRCDNCFKK